MLCMCVCASIQQVGHENRSRGKAAAAAAEHSVSGKLLAREYTWIGGTL